MGRGAGNRRRSAFLAQEEPLAMAMGASCDCCGPPGRGPMTGRLAGEEVPREAKEGLDKSRGMRKNTCNITWLE
jgi:hypothetical protein